MFNPYFYNGGHQRKTPRALKSLPQNPIGEKIQVIHCDWYLYTCVFYQLRMYK